MPARVLLPLLLLFFTTTGLLGQALRFAAIGDSGTGDEHQIAVAAQMEKLHGADPWEFVLMLGDNIYEDGSPSDFDSKFKMIYRNLQIPFHATLGNHDRRADKGRHQIADDAFGFVGNRDEYTFEAGPMIEGKRLARFICLNSGAWKKKESLPDRERQLDAWLAESSNYHWNFVFFHHAIYSYVAHTGLAGLLTGKRGHGSDKKLRQRWEQRFVDSGIDVVLSGHDHFYQKIKPQKGIHYFVSGGAGKVRRGIKTEHPDVEWGKEAFHFMQFQVDVEQVKYEVIDDSGKVIHSGTIKK